MTVLDEVLAANATYAATFHTNCGMEFFTDEVMRGLLSNSLETAALGAVGFSDVGSSPAIERGAFTSTG